MKRMVVNVLSALLVTAAFAVLAGCKNNADGGNSSGGSGPADIVPKISSADEFAIMENYSLGRDKLILNADKTGRFEKASRSASSRAAGDELTFDASIDSLTWQLSGSKVTLSSGGKSVDLTVVESTEEREGANLKNGNQTFTAAEVVMSEIIGKHISVLRPTKEEINESLLEIVEENQTLWYINEATFTDDSAYGNAIVVYIGGNPSQKHVDTVTYEDGDVSWEIKKGAINFIPPDEDLMTRVDMKLQGNTAFIYYDHIKKAVVYSVSN